MYNFEEHGQVLRGLISAAMGLSEHSGYGSFRDTDLVLVLII